MKKGCGLLIRNKEGAYLFQWRGIFNNEGNPISDPLAFDLFGGHVDEGESPEEAMLREAEEELELILNRDKLRRVLCIVFNGVEENIFVYDETIEEENIVVLEGTGSLFLSEAQLIQMVKDNRFIERVREVIIRGILNQQLQSK